MLIKLLAGGCGYEKKMPDGSIIRSLKTPADGAFDCPEPMALRMIESGQAQALEQTAAADNSQTVSKLQAMTLKELKRLAFDCPEPMALRMIESGQAQALEQTAAADNSQTVSKLQAMTLKELKRLADKAGLSYPAGVTKADLIEALEDDDV